PKEVSVPRDTTLKQTFEMRSPDCSADTYQLMAGLCVACRIGLEMPEEEALKIAREKYVDMDIHRAENAAKLATLKQLPTCCAESAAALEDVRKEYEAADVFRPKMIDGIVKSLRSYNDSSLHEAARKDAGLMKKLVDQFYDC
ncbi:MAG: glutamine synthetase, partial [Bacteroidales bacterium]|nr:glutamine synthetase [Bacteroidales bacterium]